MNNQKIAVIVPASNNSDVGIVGVKNEVPGLSVGHGNFCTIVMLAGYAAALAEDDCAVGSIIEHPIHEAGAVEAEGAVGAGGFTACGPYLLKLAPASIPADHPGLAAPEVIDLADKR